MVERGVDRAEERASQLSAFGIRERFGHFVQRFVLPPIVARHVPYIGSIDHAQFQFSGNCRERLAAADQFATYVIPYSDDDFSQTRI
jgi:hypothetical protein